MKRQAALLLLLITGVAVAANIPFGTLTVKTPAAAPSPTNVLLGTSGTDTDYRVAVYSNASNIGTGVLHFTGTAVGSISNGVAGHVWVQLNSGTGGTDNVGVDSTNTPSGAGLMLYSSGASKTTAYWGAAPTGGGSTNGLTALADGTGTVAVVADGTGTTHLSAASVASLALADSALQSESDPVAMPEITNLWIAVSARGQHWYAWGATLYTNAALNPNVVYYGHLSESGAATVESTVSGITNNQYVGGCLTTGTVSSLAAQPIDFNVWCKKGTAGTLSLAAEFYTWDGTSLVELATTPAKTITSTKTEVLWTINVPATNFAAPRYLLGSLKASGVAGSPSLTVYTDGAEDSHMAFSTTDLVIEESDPVWSAVSNTVTTQASNGNIAYGWGNHATNGYLTTIAHSNTTGLGILSSGHTGTASRVWGASAAGAAAEIQVGAGLALAANVLTTTATGSQATDGYTNGLTHWFLRPGDNRNSLDYAPDVMGNADANWDGGFDDPDWHGIWNTDDNGGADAAPFTSVSKWVSVTNFSMCMWVCPFGVFPALTLPDYWLWTADAGNTKLILMDLSNATNNSYRFTTRTGGNTSSPTINAKTNEWELIFGTYESGSTVMGKIAPDGTLSSNRNTRVTGAIGALTTVQLGYTSGRWPYGHASDIRIWINQTNVLRQATWESIWANTRGRYFHDDDK